MKINKYKEIYKNNLLNYKIMFDLKKKKRKSKKERNKEKNK